MIFQSTKVKVQLKYGQRVGYMFATSGRFYSSHLAYSYIKALVEARRKVQQYTYRQEILVTALIERILKQKVHMLW